MHHREFEVVSHRVTQREIRHIFGAGAVVSRVGSLQLVHLDAPTAEEIKARLENFDAGQLLEKDCPLCQWLRSSLKL